MSDALSSSPSRGANKVTYSGKVKKRRVRDATYKDSGPPESDSEEDLPLKTTQTAKMATRTPKKVEVHLPGPSPRGTPNDSASQPPSTKKPASIKKRMQPRAGSVASLAREDTLVGDESPTKPVSTTSKKPQSSIQRTDIQEDVADDASTAGDSVKRPRKTEADRRQFLEDDPKSGEVEPHRMFCKACNTWVDLNPKLRYIMKLWNEHRKQCDKAHEGSESVNKDEEGDDDNASVAPSLADTPGQIKRVKKEEDRKAIIESSPNAGEIQPHKVFCKGCETWIKLGRDTRYSLRPWRLHSSRCLGNLPSTRVATAQRKLQLVNDSQVKEFKPDAVSCKVCNTEVKLDGEFEYDLTKWDAHKETCSPFGPTSPKAPASSSTYHPPPSVASTEETVVGTENTTPQKNRKRSREDDDEAADRTVRQRGASYEPPQGENPGFLSWIIQPFKNFLRGFQEGMAGSSETQATSAPSTSA